MCKRNCPYGYYNCCINCIKLKECNHICEDIGKYEYTENCPDYIQEESI